MRIWFKIMKENRMVKDTTITMSDDTMTRTQKIFGGLEQACYAFDLGQPIWLEHNIGEFKKRGRTRFLKDNFVEVIDFDYLDMHIIEE